MQHESDVEARKSHVESDVVKMTCGQTHHAPLTSSSQENSSYKDLP